MTFSVGIYHEDSSTVCGIKRRPLFRNNNFQKVERFIQDSYNNFTFIYFGEKKERLGSNFLYSNNCFRESLRKFNVTEIQLLLSERDCTCVYVRSFATDIKFIAISQPSYIIVCVFNCTTN